MTRGVMLGYDFQWFSMQGEKLPLYAPIDMHLIVVDGSGSGKSTAVLYCLYKLKKYNCCRGYSKSKYTKIVFAKILLKSVLEC